MNESQVSNIQYIYIYIYWILLFPRLFYSSQFTHFMSRLMFWAIFSKSMLLRRFVFENFPGSSDGKEQACNAGDPGSIPGSERPPGEENGNTRQYSCPENPRDTGAWWATVHGVACKESDDSVRWLSHFHIYFKTVTNNFYFYVFQAVNLFYKYLLNILCVFL